MKKDIFSHRLLASRIKSEDVQNSERIFGYFIGPCLVSIVSMALFGSYLIQFYTDVLSLTGGVLAWLPLTSNVIGGLMGLLVGGWIDRTRTVQGKAHPWLLLSALLMPLSGLLLYNVPATHVRLQSAWVIVSYIFYFGIVGAFNTLSHSLLIPLSTRNVEQRDRLVLLSSTASSMIPGCLNTFVLPCAIRAIGIGTKALKNWRTVMSLLALLLLPAILLEYYFTRERITEQPKPKTEQADFLRRLNACFTNRQWLLLLLFMVSQSFFSAFFSSSTIYYCNWILCDSVYRGTEIQVLVHMAQAPMAFGMFLIWPAARRFGKHRTAWFGYLLAAFGSLIMLLSSGDLNRTLIGLFIRSLGTTANFLNTSFQAEALDAIETRSGFRADGFSFSVIGIFQSAFTGIAQTIMLSGLGTFGYIAPHSVAEVIIQPQSLQSFLSLCFAGLPILGFLICAAVMFTQWKHSSKHRKYK